MGTNLDMKRASVDIQACITPPSDYPCSDFLTRLKTTFNRIDRIAKAFWQRFAPRHTAGDRRDLRREHAIFILEIIDLEFFVILHKLIVLQTGRNGGGSEDGFMRRPQVARGELCFAAAVRS